MYYIGVDLGGTNIAVGLVDEDGKILAKKSTPTDNKRESRLILEDMARLCNEIIAENGISKDQVHSIGVGSPGVPNSKEGKVMYSNNIKFFDVDVRGVVSNLTGLDVYVDNDANCAALAESAAGAAKGYKDSVTITLGTGVGSGVVIDGKIFSGFNFAAPEIGHMVIQMDGEPCTCGRTGCWEVYASATGLIRETIKAGRANPSSLVNKVAKDGKLENASARTAFEAAKLGDKVGQELVDNFIKALGVGLVNVINVFQPEIVCIGGGISNEGEYLLKPLRKFVVENSYGNMIDEKLLPRTKIVKAQMGNDAGIIGAAMLGKQ